MSGKAFVTPEVLKWARTTANITLEEVAKRAKTDIEWIKSWEDGKSYPTIRQAQILAKTYRRPLAVFFLPKPPKDFMPLQDFRSNSKGQLSTALIFMIREIQEKQLWASATFEENDEDKLDFVGKFDRRTSEEIVAADIRKTLGIQTQHLGSNPLRYWIQKAEASRIFVSLSSNIHTRMKLDSDEVKGFAIADVYAPFVFINTDDYDNAQLFTLVHELAHLWINQSGISVDVEITFRDNRHKIDPVEVFCNKVAVNALVPAEELRRYLSNERITNFETVLRAARTFKVSSLTMLYRTFDLALIGPSQLRSWRKESDRQFTEYLLQQEAKSKIAPGFMDPFLSKVRRNGRAFSQLVLDYYKSGYINGLETSTLLHVKLNQLPKIEKILYA